MLRIESLSQEQKSLIPIVRDEFIGHGLSTLPADRKKAEAAVCNAYIAAGLKTPKIFIWMDSPMAGLVTVNIMNRNPREQVRGQVGNQVWGQVRNQVGDQVWEQVWDHVGDHVGDQVRNQVRNQAWDQVGNQVGNQVWGQVRNQVRNQVGEQVWGQVGDQVWEQVRDQVWNQVGDQNRLKWLPACYGQHESDWLSFYSFFSRIGLQGIDRILPLIETAKHLSWWWPFQDVCILTDRPRSIHRDAEGRLHSGTGKAIEYRDGWGVYAWHGVRVPDIVIEHPENITAKMVEEEINAEIRRCMIERMGVSKYVRDGGFEVIHEDTDPLGLPRRLLRKEKDGETDLMVVELTNSTREPDGTRKIYHLRVHPELRPFKGGMPLGEPQELTCQNAVASTFYMRGEEYQLEIET